MKPLLYSILWGLAVLLAIFTLILGYQYVFGETLPTYQCEIGMPEQVYDGDTLKDVRVLIKPHEFSEYSFGEHWPGVFITERGVEIQTDIRIGGIDTPEKRTSTKNADGSPRSEASRQREKDASLAARQALIDLLSSNANTFTISNPIHGKYAGRTVADVVINEVDVATFLIQAGHAKPYDGGTKPEWNWGD